MQRERARTTPKSCRHDMRCSRCKYKALGVQRAGSTASCCSTARCIIIFLADPAACPSIREITKRCPREDSTQASKSRAHNLPKVETPPLFYFAGSTWACTRQGSVFVRTSKCRHRSKPCLSELSAPGQGTRLTRLHSECQLRVEQEVSCNPEQYYRRSKDHGSIRAAVRIAVLDTRTWIIVPCVWFGPFRK